jgi:Flp pilus assembly protein TadG
MPKPSPLSPIHRPAPLRGDARGGVLIEAALSLPILVIFLIGILTYGAWFMAAHVVQQAANEGARAALAGIDDVERRSLADQTVTRSLGGANLVDPALIVTSTQTADGYFTVTVTYNAPQSAIFSSSIIPLPRGPIRRASVVKLSMS